jgi:hypothetical protein
MKTLNRERCAFVLKLNPLELGIIAFLKNFRTLVILLQIDPTSSDESEIICEGFYEN